MLKPSVGEMVSMASPMSFLITVVLPALSRPSTSRRISFSACLIFLRMVRRPMAEAGNVDVEE
jgi:hypothetical protein